ncbi:CHAP domain-containing protein [Arthrobacter bambusae]
MRGIFRAGVAGFIVLVLAAGFLAAVLVGAVSGAEKGRTDTVACGAFVVDAGLNASSIPADFVQDIQDAAQVSGLPASVIAGQIRAESNWNPKAVSPAGARGIAQFMPGTWAGYGAGKDPFDPHAGIAAQGKFMGELFAKAKASGLKGDPVDLALAGYNAGWGAVLMVGGVPDNGESSQYVTKIRGYAAGYAKAGGTTAVPASTPTGCAAATGSITGNDDYPFKNLPHCLLNADGSYAGCPPGSQSEFNAYNGECVDFVMWRLNQQFGVTKAPWKITNNNFRPDGASLGNAKDYRGAWENKGWPVDRTPQVGSVAWFGPGNPNASSAGYGHVEIVKEVLPDGSYIAEGYNFGFPPNDHKYYTMKRPNTAPDAFLHLPRAA